jgi:hypothetical protein
VSGTFGTTLGARDGAEWNPWLGASGPVDETDATALVTLADLSGMRSASKVGLGLNYLKWSWTASADAQRALCTRLYADPALVSDSIATIVRGAIAVAKEDRKNFVRDSVAAYLASKACGTRHILRVEQQRALESLIDYGQIWLFGIGAEYGRTTFRYADTVAVAYTKQTREPWSASIGGGLYLPNQRTLVSGTLRYERSFEGGMPRQYCIPIGTTPGTQCRSLALGPPERGTPLLLTGELRWFANAQAGMSPRLTVDLSGKRGTGIELPILLRQDADKGFASALALGWRSKETSPNNDDRLYVSLVVGVTFGIGLKL